MTNGRQESTSSGGSEEDGENEVADEERVAQVARRRRRADTPMPLLASDALKEDLAPIEPAGNAARWWMALAGAWFTVTGLAPLAGGPSEGGPTTMVIGGMVLAGAIAPIGYVSRAALMLVAALAVGLLATVGTGPAWIGGHAHGAWAGLHLTAGVVLPAALLFRARYRAYGPARLMLTVALVLTAPFVVYAVVTLARGTLPVQIATGVALAAIAGSVLGFMGSETNVAGDGVAATVIAAVAAQLGVAALSSGAGRSHGLAGMLSAAASGVAFGWACLLGALGAFMLLAARHWKRARIVDIHRHVVEHPPPTLTDSWSTRK